MRRFEKAAEFVQGETFGNVIDFFQAQRDVKKPKPPKKPDYTPLYILGAIAVVVAIIKR